MHDWSVLLAFQAPEDSGEALTEDDDRIDALLDVLHAYAPVAVFGGSRWSVAVSIAALAPDEAWDHASQLIDEMATKVDLPRWPLVRTEMLRDDEQERELAEPNFPEILGTREVTERLDITRQRLHELRTAGRFPAPMVELAAGPIWLRSTVEAFVEQWERKPGRPAKSVQEILADADKLDEDLGRFGNGQMGGPFPPSGS